VKGASPVLRGGRAQLTLRKACIRLRGQPQQLPGGRRRIPCLPREETADPTRCPPLIEALPYSPRQSAVSFPVGPLRGPLSLIRALQLKPSGRPTEWGEGDHTTIGSFSLLQPC
jgi:hypothetical protein